MEKYEKILETLSSITRIRLIKLLMQRPRCLSELSDLLGISPQAVIKHLKILEKNSFIDSIIPKESIGLVRKIYRLRKPIYINLDSFEGIDCIYAFKGEESIKLELEIPKERFYNTLQRIEDEKFNLIRRLKSLRDKEIRIIRELFSLENLEKYIIKKANYTTFEEILLYTALSSEFEKELENFSKYFGLSIDETKKVIKNLVEKSK
ncbi:MAG: ArsR family transcriptional regulator [Nitrososphaerales archaeon]